jgi:PhzF family phenazine biosynthesis protein
MPAGMIEVRIDAQRTRYTMFQPPPQFLRCYDHAGVAAALGLRSGDIIPNVEPQTVSTGLPQLMVALTDREALARCKPQRDLLFGSDRDWFSVHCFTKSEAGRDAIIARHFTDIAESPFTGSAMGAMAGYCARYGLLELRSYSAVQGEFVGRSGRAYIDVGGTFPNAIGEIAVTGEAVTLLEGTLSLPDS